MLQALLSFLGKQHQDAVIIWVGNWANVALFLQTLARLHLLHNRLKNQQVKFFPPHCRHAQRPTSFEATVAFFWYSSILFIRCYAHSCPWWDVGLHLHPLSAEWGHSMLLPHHTHMLCMQGALFSEELSTSITNPGLSRTVMFCCPFSLSLSRLAVLLHSDCGMCGYVDLHPSFEHLSLYGSVSSFFIL